MNATTAKRGRGRPTLYTPAAVELAASGLPLTKIAAHLDVTVRAVTEWTHRHAEFREAVERGRARARERLCKRPPTPTTMPVPAVADQPCSQISATEEPHKLVKTPTGYRAPGAPRWWQQRRPAASGGHGTAHSLRGWCPIENNDGEPVDMEDPLRDW